MFVKINESEYVNLAHVVHAEEGADGVLTLDMDIKETYANDLGEYESILHYEVEAEHKKNILHKMGIYNQAIQRLANGNF